MKHDREFGTVCGCAIRYSLGRQTYISSTVQNYIIQNIDRIDSLSIEIMISDIDKASSLGDEKIDKPCWISFKNCLGKELNKRKNSQ